MTCGGVVATATDAARQLASATAAAPLLGARCVPGGVVLRILRLSVVDSQSLAVFRNHRLTVI